ncbi:MAG TPA: hypothetical protein VLQ80_11630, partial [Candidatus Saccharimonadia bacterium]|nr:hypothetical protein [Candidatus Saccharimonadia bacterium]
MRRPHGHRTAGCALSTDASPCASLRGASQAGTLPKLHGWQQFGCPCAPFSPARVDNLLEEALSHACHNRCGLPVAGAAGRQRRAVAGSRGLHPSGVPGIPGRTAGSGPVCTALRRQGRAVARAKSPRHRRLRLRHEIHRRGNASAASRP